MLHDTWLRLYIWRHGLVWWILQIFLAWCNTSTALASIHRFTGIDNVVEWLLRWMFPCWKPALDSTPMPRSRSHFFYLGSKIWEIVSKLFLGEITGRNSFWQVETVETVSGTIRKPFQGSTFFHCLRFFPTGQSGLSAKCSSQIRLNTQAIASRAKQYATARKSQDVSSKPL